MGLQRVGHNLATEQQQQNLSSVLHSLNGILRYCRDGSEGRGVERGAEVLSSFLVTRSCPTLRPHGL